MTEQTGVRVDAVLPADFAEYVAARGEALQRFAFLVSGGVPDSADDAEAAEAWRLCAELPAAQRAAVVMRFHEDLSFAAIARVLDCAEATARSHVHRALATLRGRLNQGEDDD